MCMSIMPYMQRYMKYQRSLIYLIIYLMFYNIFKKYTKILNFSL